MENIVTLLAGAGLASAVVGAVSAYLLMRSKHLAEETYIEILKQHQQELIEKRMKIAADGVISVQETEEVLRILLAHTHELEPKQRSLITSPLRQESFVGRKAYAEKVFARAGVSIEVGA